MRHRNGVKKLGRPGAARRAMLGQQVCSLIREGSITTTVTKAKVTSSLAEKMVTLGKKGDLHARRRAASILKQKDCVQKLFDDVAPRYTERNGGYTRVIRLGARRGDNSELAILEWVAGKPASAKAEKTSAKDEPVSAE
jgi:large subunit ribosomal protein L17